jgi:hypothetical protein
MTKSSVRQFALPAIFVLTLVGLSIPRPADAMYRYWMRFYFEDDTFQTVIGERSYLCTWFYSWGDTSEWVFTDAGSCNSGGTFSDGDCRCCWDSNGNGGCDVSEDVHVCTASQSCRPS